MSAAYTVTCHSFYPDRVPTSASLGNSWLLIDPPGLLLVDVLIISMEQGIRTLFPARAVLKHGQPARSKAGKLVTHRPARFPDPEDWAEFSEVAVAAIDAKFPGLLSEVAALKTLPPRDGLSVENVPISTDRNGVNNHHV